VTHPTGDVREIQCACKGVTIEVTGQPQMRLHCHCDDCQLASGGSPYLPVAIFPADKVKITKGLELVRTFTLKVTPRSFCKGCGNRLLATPQGGTVIAVNGYLLEGVTASRRTYHCGARLRRPLIGNKFKANFHNQTGQSPLVFVDDLPKYKGAAPAFGGNETQVAWANVDFKVNKGASCFLSAVASLIY